MIHHVCFGLGDGGQNKPGKVNVKQKTVLPYARFKESEMLRPQFYPNPRGWLQKDGKLPC